MERRQTPRFPVRCPITFTGDLIHGEGTVMDLSTEGCCVQTRDSVEDRSYVNLFLHLPHHNRPMKVELAAIRWADEYSFGLEFIRMTPEQLRQLHRFLQFIQMAPTHRPQVFS